MRCNIDARGKAVRLIVGGAMLVISAVLLALILTDVLSVRWGWVAGGVACFGAFGVVQARAGWCVVRAMGFSTRI